MVSLATAETIMQLMDVELMICERSMWKGPPLFRWCLYVCTLAFPPNLYPFGCAQDQRTDMDRHGTTNYCSEGLSFGHGEAGRRKEWNRQMCSLKSHRTSQLLSSTRLWSFCLKLQALRLLVSGSQVFGTFCEQPWGVYVPAGSRQNCPESHYLLSCFRHLKFIHLLPVLKLVRRMLWSRAIALWSQSGSRAGPVEARGRRVITLHFQALWTTVWPTKWMNEWTNNINELTNDDNDDHQDDNDLTLATGPMRNDAISEGNRARPAALVDSRSGAWRGVAWPGWAQGLMSCLAHAMAHWMFEASMREDF